MDKFQAVRVPPLNKACFPGLLSDSLFWTEVAAGATAVTELGKRQYMIAEHSNSVISAYLSTLAAVGTLIFGYLRHQYLHRLATGNTWLQKDVSVRLLDITVQKHNFVAIFYGKGKAGGYQSLTRSTFTAGDRDDHLASHHLGSTLGAAHVVTGSAHLVRDSRSATGADTVSTGA